MNFDNATDAQLLNIITHDKGCPNDLLSLVAEEMIKRKLWDNLVFYAAKLVYKHVNSVLSSVLFMDRDDLNQIAYIEIMHASNKFKQGLSVFNTFVVNLLKLKFKKLIRDANAEKRQIDFNKDYIENSEEKEQDRYFQSHVNVEKGVINKLTIQYHMSKLRDIEQRAIKLELSGYTQYEIAESLGFNKTYGNILINRAYKKLRVR